MINPEIESAIKEALATNPLANKLVRLVFSGGPTGTQVLLLRLENDTRVEVTGDRLYGLEAIKNVSSHRVLQYSIFNAPQQFSPPLKNPIYLDILLKRPPVTLDLSRAKPQGARRGG
jgi:hypothetical protein